MYVEFDINLYLSNKILLLRAMQLLQQDSNTNEYAGFLCKHFYVYFLFINMSIISVLIDLSIV